MLSYILAAISVVILWYVIVYLLQRRRRKNTIAFFHLYCSSGGGGERVLWHTIEALFKKHPNYTIYIYSHKNIQNDTLRILRKVHELFKIDLISDQNLIDRLEFVPLFFSPLIEAKRYPYLTLFCQNIGSILLACEAAYRLLPEVYLETIGFTFTLPIFKLHRCTVITYVHYPTISSDMIQNVRTSTHSSFNNREIFVKYPILRNAKLIYYRALAYCYGLAGRQANLVLVNSTWTQNHIKSLWNTEAHVVYPPCDIDSFKTLRAKRSLRRETATQYKPLNIVSIAQFRPEKNHDQQIEAFDIFLHKTEAFDSRLTLYGGCRDDDDFKRVENLRELIHNMDSGPNIEIVVGASFQCLLEGMKDSEVALHTMKNEHFGIVLLECMAAGLIMVAHDSGGPKTDIIEDGVNGFLANSEAEFAEKLVKISSMSNEERQKICENATKKSEQFSTQVFEERLLILLEPFLSKAGK